MIDLVLLQARNSLSTNIKVSILIYREGTIDMIIPDTLKIRNIMTRPYKAKHKVI